MAHQVIEGHQLKLLAIGGAVGPRSAVHPDVMHVQTLWKLALVEAHSWVKRVHRATEFDHLSLKGGIIFDAEGVDETGSSGRQKTIFNADSLLSVQD